MNGTNVANEMSVVSEVNMSEIALKLAEQLSLREVLVNNFNEQTNVCEVCAAEIVMNEANI